VPRLDLSSSQDQNPITGAAFQAFCLKHPVNSRVCGSA
jgi:hypothetical protein